MLTVEAYTIDEEANIPEPHSVLAFNVPQELKNWAPVPHSPHRQPSSRQMSLGTALMQHILSEVYLRTFAKASMIQVAEDIKAQYCRRPGPLQHVVKPAPLYRGAPLFTVSDLGTRPTRYFLVSSKEVKGGISDHFDQFPWY